MSHNASFFTPTYSGMQDTVADLQSLLFTNIRTYKFVFVKGLQKKQFLLKHIIHNKLKRSFKLRSLWLCKTKVTLRSENDVPPTL